jgi:hypothetical protein
LQIELITLEQKFQVIGRHERGHRIYGKKYYETRRGIKEKGKSASAFYGLQTSRRNRRVTMLEMERLLTVWIEHCRQTQHLCCSSGPRNHRNI